MQRRAAQGGRRVGAASKGVSVCVCEQSSKRGAADAFAIWYDRVVGLTYDACAGIRKGRIAHATVRAAAKWFDDGPPCTQRASTPSSNKTSSRRSKGMQV